MEPRGSIPTNQASQFADRCDAETISHMETTESNGTHQSGHCKSHGWNNHRQSGTPSNFRAGNPLQAEKQLTSNLPQENPFPPDQTAKRDNLQFPQCCKPSRTQCEWKRAFKRLLENGLEDDNHAGTAGIMDASMGRFLTARKVTPAREDTLTS